MDLSTKYLGFEFDHPFMPGASSLVRELDVVKRLEDAGAAAIVLNSLFEEQIAAEQQETVERMLAGADSFAEALSYFPEPEDFDLGPDEYLKHLAAIKSTVSVPVIASLNGTTEGSWIDYGTLMQEAGADALELNLYHLPTDPRENAADIERDLIELVRAVRGKVTIPLAVKLSPFLTAPTNFASQLEKAGADGLVIFNRFYQPDINVEDLEVERSLRLSSSAELLLRLRWLAILSSHLELPLAVTGGVHTPVDAVKAIMSGASIIQMVSAFMRNGPEHLATMIRELDTWMSEHEYESLEQMRGSMNLARCPDATAYERANYMSILHSFKGGMWT